MTLYEFPGPPLIKERIVSRKGFHGQAAAKKKCNECHREHLGLQHEIMALDKRTFDHKLTGWPLVGAHGEVACRECHTAWRPKTKRPSYLGASTRCSGCHGEYHGEAVKTELSSCESCHNTYDWKRVNATLSFDHNKETQFPLTGKHRDQECDKCHLGKRQFGPIEVSGCVTCHKDPHPKGIFGRRICEDCHLTQDMNDMSLYDHSSTGWPLRGKHEQNKCTDCHSWKRWKPKGKACQSCHQDSHDGQFSDITCHVCHQETGFKGRNLKFDHSAMSQFPLKGKHLKVRCGNCHPKGLWRLTGFDMEEIVKAAGRRASSTWRVMGEEPGSDSRNFTIACRNCHRDESPHPVTYGETPCSNCHSPKGWNKTHFDHTNTGFPLEGKHATQPCHRCHPDGTEAKDDTVQACSFCHTDIHSGQFPDSECDRCHRGVEGWQIPLFDHTQSRFQRNGKHLTVDCAACHRKGHFRPIDAACGNCHYNFHEGQFSKACSDCHFTDGWSARIRFDHAVDSSYPLRGKHQEIACGKCHLNNRYVGLAQRCEDCHYDSHRGEKGGSCERCHTFDSWTVNRGQDHDFAVYRLGGRHDLLGCERCHGVERDRALAGRGPECGSCHRDAHFGSFGPLCLDCHTQNYWLPSTFIHSTTGFRLSGAHRFVECRDCHPNRVFGGLPNQCDFCHSDAFAQTAGSRLCDHTVCLPGGRFACHNCHTTLSWSPPRAGADCGLCEGGRP